MSLAILNDLHIGAIRSAGTTVQSAFKLRAYALEHFETMLHNIDEDLAINGDLFDGYQIPLNDALYTVKALRKWLKKGKKLFMIPGNHDLSTNSEKLSTFQFVSEVLRDDPNVQYLEGGGWLNEEEGIYAISHVANQDLFDYQLSLVPECKFLLLHCNWNNGFAKELDHSLNLSADIAKTIPAKKIILGHEHQAGSHLDGKVEIPGNQFPMSVSDCLGSNSKSRMRLLSDGTVDWVKTWDSAEYVEYDWKDIKLGSTEKFIRVTGVATVEESTAAVDAVANLRKVSDAYVVGSSVKMLSGEAIDVDEALASVEIVRAFDVDKALRELLREDQIKTLESLK